MEQIPQEKIIVEYELTLDDVYNLYVNQQTPLII